MAVTASMPKNGTPTSIMSRRRSDTPVRRMNVLTFVRAASPGHGRVFTRGP